MLSLGMQGLFTLENNNNTFFKNTCWIDNSYIDGSELNLFRFHIEPDHQTDVSYVLFPKRMQNIYIFIRCFKNSLKKHLSNRMKFNTHESSIESSTLAWLAIYIAVLYAAAAYTSSLCSSERNECTQTTNRGEWLKCSKWIEVNYTLSMRGCSAGCSFRLCLWLAPNKRVELSFAETHERVLGIVICASAKLAKLISIDPFRIHIKRFERRDE